jgi:hypothetical protein
MPDLTPEHVRTHLAAIDLAPLDAEDLEEITYRINAVTEALLALEPEGLDDAEPMTVFGAEDPR